MSPPGSLPQPQERPAPSAPWAGAPADKLAQRYYDATSWIYRWAWGASFHFAPLRVGEPRRAAIQRYECELATELGLSRGSLCLDLGCGIGGPAATIAATTTARVVGVNSNLGQLRTLRALGAAGIEGVGASFEDLAFADASFDRAYSFEALCHAVDLEAALREVFRVLRPGGVLGFSEWCLTEGFDPRSDVDRDLRAMIEAAYGVVALKAWPEWQSALGAAGFRIETRVDRGAGEGRGEDPWYRALQPRDRSFDSLGRGAAVRALEARVLSLVERCRLAPAGTAATVRQLRAGTTALIEAGRRRIFTPMLFVRAAKPL